jgi:hypothetical protein
MENMGHSLQGAYDKMNITKYFILLLYFEVWNLISECLLAEVGLIFYKN